jgi:YD repeat-containing protein
MKRKFAVILGGVAAVASLTSASIANETTTFTYDELGRLTGKSISGTVNNGVTTGSCYDAAGNRSNYATVTVSGRSFSISGARAYEGTPLVFTVSRLGDTTAAASVSYATAPGTAITPKDYTTTSGTLSFAANETCKLVSVTTKVDSLNEPDEVMNVNLSNPSAGSAIGTGSAQGIIYGPIV